MSPEPSEQQLAIFDHFAERWAENLVVRARAGTGKTWTILRALNYAPEQKILLAAFNRSIAKELQTKLTRQGAKAQTLHALGMAYLGMKWKGVEVDNTKSLRLAQYVCGPNTSEEIIAAVRKLSSLAKNVNPQLDKVFMQEIGITHDVFPYDEDTDKMDRMQELIITATINCCTLSLENDGFVDYDDMIYVPLMNKFVFPRFDLVVVDEAQDMNASQLLLARKACKKRMVVVGDDRQSIYSFRGADHNTIDRLKRDLRARELGLTITYRCPKSVVAYAKTIVPDYQAAPTAPEGIIRSVHRSKLGEQALPGDFILSRRNAILVSGCIDLLRAGKPAKIAGKGLSQHLIGLVKKFKNEGIPRFLEKLAKWEEKHIRRAHKLPETKVEEMVRQIKDTTETLRLLSDGCNGMEELQLRINNMFVDEVENPDSVVVLSSIHKAKGQERNRVFLYEEGLYPGAAKSPEEMNLEYVAVTRAKQELIWVQ